MLKIKEDLILILLFAVSTAAMITYEKTNEPKRITGEVIIHTYASGEEGIFANAYIIELEGSLVVVDATLTVSTSTALKVQTEQLGKPIAAILITHAHPDHYNGLGNLAGEEDIPIYSTPTVLDEITKTDAAKEEQWVPMFGEEWPRNRIFPNNTVEHSETITIEGVDFTVMELGPGESHNDTYWVMESEDRQYAFIGDVVLNRVHAYLADGHYKEWLQNLSFLKEELQGFETIYPGHGEPGGLELLEWQEQYINTYVGHVKELLGDRDQLTVEDKAELTGRMKEFLPNTKLEFLIGLSADVVAAQVKLR